MIHILDTDVLTLAQLPDSAEYLRLHARVLQLDAQDILATTIITYEEQTRGWLAYLARSRDLAHQVKAYSLLKKHLQHYLNLGILEFDTAAASEFERLRRLKLRLGAADLKIAAITLSQNALLISRNLRDFQSIPNLKVEDWTR